MFIAVRRGKNGAWALVQERPAQADPDSPSEVVPIGQMVELVPGLSVAIEDFELPDTKLIDLVGVDARGDVTLGLCRLARSAEIRQMCVSRLLEMAAQLRQEVPFREFEQRVLLLKGRPVEELVRDALPEEERARFDPREFRLRLAQNLEQGRFRLVLAVDEVGEEFESFLDYLHDSSDGLIRFEPVELVIYDCEGMQVMVPRFRPDPGYTSDEDLFAAEEEAVDRMLDQGALPDAAGSISASGVLRLLNDIPRDRDDESGSDDPFESLDEVLEAEAAAAEAELEAMEADGEEFPMSISGRQAEENAFFDTLREACSPTAARSARRIMSLGREPSRSLPAGWVVSADTLSFQVSMITEGPCGLDPLVVELFRLENDGALVFDVAALNERISADVLDEFLRDLESNPLLIAVLACEEDECAIPLDQVFVTDYDVRTFCTAVRRLVNGLGLVGGHDSGGREAA